MRVNLKRKAKPINAMIQQKFRFSIDISFDCLISFFKLLPPQTKRDDCKSIFQLQWRIINAQIHRRLSIPSQPDQTQSKPREDAKSSTRIPRKIDKDLVSNTRSWPSRASRQTHPTLPTFREGFNQAPPDRYESVHETKAINDKISITIIFTFNLDFLLPLLSFVFRFEIPFVDRVKEDFYDKLWIGGKRFQLLDGIVTNTRKSTCDSQVPVDVNQPTQADHVSKIRRLTRTEFTQ